MSQLQVTGEAKIRDIQGPVVANSGVVTALDGAASQYVRGDGTLADFPTSTGGGSSVSYYLNSSVSQGTIGGVAYRELSKEPIIGAGTDITISANGYVASYITDANDPDVTIVPGGNFNCEFYFSVNNNTGNPTTYAELYKYDGTTFTLLGSSQAVPESLNQGTTIAPYYFAIPVATAALALTDRLAIRIYVNVDGRTVTLHTENSHLCQVVTTFSKGMVSLNNLTDQSQYLATGTSGTDFNIVSTGDTHTFNLPVASATNTGKLSSTDWSTFNNKQAALSFTAPLVNTSNTISIPAATSLVDGYLDNLDWVNFNTAYNDSIVSAAVTGTTTKTLTLNQQDGGTITASWTDINTDAVTSVFGRTGAVVAASGDYTTTQVTEGTNLYYTDARSRGALSFTAGSGAYNSTTGVITIPTNNNQITNGAGYITSSALSGYLPLTGGTLTGALSGTSATFVGSIQSTGGSGFATSIDGGFRLRNDANNANLGGLTRRSYWAGGTALDTQIFAETGYGIFLNVNGSSNAGLSLASTGAATFSSSVTATNGIFSGEVYNTTTGAFFIANAIGNTSYPTYGFYNNVGVGMYRPSADVLGFVTSSTERMRITSGGNVGIGTSSPVQPLQLGLVSVIAQDANSMYIGANFGNGTGGNYIRSQFANQIHFDSALGFINFKVAGSGTAGNAISYTTAMAITSGGNVLIGTTTDNGQGKLQVNGAITSANISLTGELVSSTTTFNSTYYHIISGATGSGQTFTLPTPSNNNLQYVIINKSNHTQTIAAGGSFTIYNLAGSDVATITLASKARCFIIADGSGFYQIF